MNQKRKVITAIAVSVVLIAAGVASIAIFGYTEPPKYESLKANPDSSIEGKIAFVHAGANGQNCLKIVAASGGEPKELTCGDTYQTSVQFTKDGNVVYTRATGYDFNSPSSATVFDGDTGKELETFSVPRSDFAPSSSQDLYTAGEDYSYEGDIFNGDDGPHDTWVSRDPEGKDRIVTKHVPNDYDFTQAQYSPDKKWILIFDSDGSLLVASENGQVRKLVDSSGNEDDYFHIGFGSSQSIWFQPGSSQDLVDVNELKKTPTTSTMQPQDFSRAYQDQIEVRQL